MDNIRTTAILAIAALASLAASAEIRATNIRRVSFGDGERVSVGQRHPSFSDPGDPFHDTYDRNAGRLNDEAPKRVANIQAKIAAAEKARARREKEAAAKSPISVYSNFGSGAVCAVTTPATPAETPQQPAKVVNIYNSTVVVN